MCNPVLGTGIATSRSGDGQVAQNIPIPEPARESGRFPWITGTLDPDKWLAYATA